MSVSVYSSRQDFDEQRLLEAVGFVRIEMCRNIDQLRHCLDAPGRARKIVILLVRDQEEMAGLTRLVEMYLDLLLIIILDEDNFATTREAHRLRPRYITYKGDDFQDLAGVLGRMINRLY